MSDLFSENDVAREGDLIQLQGANFKSHIFRLQSGQTLQTHRGVIKHDQVIGQPWGSRLESHQGNPFYLFQPGLADLIKATKRTTQIMYPKEIAYALLVMGVGPGKRVLECGTGSGAMTTALAYNVGETGKVYSYERKSEAQSLAIKNLTQLGMQDRVVFKLGDAADGFEERGLDAIFLDVQDPYNYLAQAKRSLKGGGYLGILVPTVNQVVKCLSALRNHRFAFVEASELIMRYWKTDWDHLRPIDRMVAHTGFLIFGRSVNQGLETFGEMEEGEP